MGQDPEPFIRVVRFGYEPEVLNYNYMYTLLEKGVLKGG